MKKSFRLVLFAVIALFALTSVIFVNAQGGNRIPPLPATGSYQPNAQEQALAQVYQRVIQSVVNISVVTTGGGGTGTGFVIDPNGYIVTNNHVVEGAQFIQVNFFDGTLVEADLIGRDPDSDLALIKVDPSQVILQPVFLGDSDQVFVGQSVMAIGNPLGQDFTLTTGIVSALDRSLSAESNFSIPGIIQTDAAINPGNSGGPLLDLSGNVIGVNTAILSEGTGIGFAVPVNQVRRVIPYLMAEGQYTHSYLGISGSTVQPAQREALGLPANIRGVMIVEALQGQPADLAGLQGATRAINTGGGQLAVDGDIILSINGQPITQMGDLINYLEVNTRPNDVVTMQILRNGSTLDVPVTLGTRPSR